MLFHDKYLLNSNHTPYVTLKLKNNNKNWSDLTVEY